jgi:thiol-disulfide isomerase/thioredoxin
MKTSHKVVLGGLAATVVIGAVTTGYVIYNNKNGITEEAVSAFSNTQGEEPYSDLLGNPVSLDAYLGNILVVATWASWSPFSQADLTMLNDLASELNDEEVIFMAINRKETKEQAERFLVTQPKFDKLKLILDPRDHYYLAVGGFAMPEVLVYNQRGEVVLHQRGVANREEIKSAVLGIKKLEE